MSHPCLSCGACCAYFRVSFYWREAEERQIPPELTEDYSHFLRSMKGTSEKHRVRCVALEGRLGQEVSCSIYTLRPSPCRNFDASFENGKQNVRCDQARSRHGLPPLRPKDWMSAFARGEPAATMDSHEENPSLP